MLASLLSLDASDVARETPAEIGSAGNPFLYVRLRSLEAVRRARGAADALETYFAGQHHAAVYLFSTETETPEAAGALVAILLTALLATALVIDPDGSMSGFQDKCQIDPSEEEVYTPGSERRIFQAGSMTFGIAICHEGWRYPETVRWAARRGAHVVFHPPFHVAEPGSYRPSSFADPANTFHEKAILCRAAENTCWVASVNCASAGSPTTSVVAKPDGTVLTYQPYGKEGVLFADIDLSLATGLLARRCKYG